MMAATKAASRLLVQPLLARAPAVPWLPLRPLSTAANAASSSSSKLDDGNRLQHTLYVPKAERGGTRTVFEMDKMIGETRLARNSRTCPTRELYFLNTQWDRHKSPYRKYRHMANLFRAAPFQRLLFPDLFCVTTVAGCLTYYNEFMAVSLGGQTLVMSTTAFAGATTAIGLLVGFRLNASYGRYSEGRKQWSDTNNATRDLARQTKMWMPATDNNDAQTRMLRLCQAFPITLMFHLNDKGCYHNMKRKSKAGEPPFEDRVQAEFQAELHDVYYQTTNDTDNVIDHQNDIIKKDFERLCRVKSSRGHVPLEVLTCMGETIAACSNTMNPVFARELDTQVQRLCQALGASERVLKTPVPTGFTRHSSRLLFIWSTCLPFALYPMLGPLGTLPTALLTAYAVLGIEDISVQLEEPFDILPLRQLSDSMYDGIKAIEQGFVSPMSANDDGAKNR